MKWTYLPLVAALLPATSVAAFTAEQINSARFGDQPLSDDTLTPLAIKAQVLLDRAGISPGVIGADQPALLEQALSAFEDREGFTEDGALDQDVWIELQNYGSTVTMTHYISADDTDVRGTELPTDYAELAKLDAMPYVRTTEKLAEQFHMTEDLLIDLNPDSAFREGDEITVVDPGSDISATVTRIDIELASKRLVAYDDANEIVADYPVVIGSDENPTPEGAFEVVGVAINPNFTYRPDESAQQGSGTEPLILPPGPNGPVGSVWIDLGEPRYGIHGTSDPTEINSEFSHGCVRLTNWDAMELADMVSQGVRVSFLNDDGSVSGGDQPAEPIQTDAGSDDAPN